MSKPSILIPSYDDPKFGLPTFVKAIAEPNFKLITEDELKQDPKLREHIQGIISHVPGWSFIRREIISQFTNLHVFSTASVGYEHLDLEYLKEQGIRLYFI